MLAASVPAAPAKNLCVGGGKLTLVFLFGWGGVAGCEEGRGGCMSDPIEWEGREQEVFLPPDLVNIGIFPCIFHSSLPRHHLQLMPLGAAQASLAGSCCRRSFKATLHTEQLTIPQPLGPQGWELDAHIPPEHPLLQHSSSDAQCSTELRAVPVSMWGSVWVVGAAQLGSLCKSTLNSGGRRDFRREKCRMRS